MMKVQYWLMKSEPSTFSIDDLQRDGFTQWEGVRNFQVRNIMRDEMKPGDLALFYHSNAKPRGVAGICRVCDVAKPDPTQWEPASKYYDKRAKAGKPIWFMAEVEFVEKFPQLITLADLKAVPALKELVILRKGSRLSITPLTHDQFKTICALAKQDTPTSSDLIKQR